MTQTAQESRRVRKISASSPPAGLTAGGALLCAVSATRGAQSAVSRSDSPAAPWPARCGVALRVLCGRILTDALADPIYPGLLRCGLVGATTYGCPGYGPGAWFESWVLFIVSLWADWLHVACYGQHVGMPIDSIVGAEDVGWLWVGGSYVRLITSAIAVGIPTGAVAIGAYAAITRLWGPKVVPGGETLCRACGYILRGISEPRCPECGERI